MRTVHFPDVLSSRGTGWEGEKQGRGGQALKGLTWILCLGLSGPEVLLGGNLAVHIGFVLVKLWQGLCLSFGQQRGLRKLWF